VRVARTSLRRTSGKLKCWKIATMSAMPSWKASTSRLVAALKCWRSRSMTAWVVSWATMSWLRHVKIVCPGTFAPGLSGSAAK
jgi:hypothetical protein